jgi:hypothetical protein
MSELTVNLDDLAAAAVASGNWMIRADNDGQSYRGFRWAPPGEWTEAPDWSPEPKCGGGLHGQTKDHGGFITGSRLLFCEYDPADVVTLGDKVKVRRARILLVNRLPAGLTVGGSLYLYGCTALASLPAGLTVGGSLDLHGCTSLASLPAGLTVGGSLYLGGCTALASLPVGLTVGGSLDLYGCTALASLPAGLTVGGWLDLYGCTALASLPAGLTVGGWLNLPSHLEIPHV